jgi:hypothetical protein
MFSSGLVCSKIGDSSRTTLGATKMQLQLSQLRSKSITEANREACKGGHAAQTRVARETTFSGLGLL